MNDDPFTPLDGARHHAGPGKGEPSRRIVMPVPPHAPQTPGRHPRLGVPSATWIYRNARGDALGSVCRFETDDGRKSFRPLCLFDLGKKLAWRWETWPTPRPIYGLDRLNDRPDAPVVIAEGEKASDAAQGLLDSFVCVTSPGGAKSADKAD